MRTGFLLGVLALAVAAAVVACLVIVSGAFDVSARSLGPLDRVLGYASTASLRHHAGPAVNPVAGDAKALATGLAHYKEMCVPCHGAPGVRAEEFAAGLYPPAPDLASKELQSFTDGMLYRAVAFGIGSTGMPGFHATHTPEQLWSVVAAVRRLPSLTGEERRALGAEAYEASEGAAQRGDRVVIDRAKFTPPRLEVSAGQAVSWDNQDIVAHTATADDGTFDTGEIDPGQSKKVVVSRPGTFPYSCTYHGAMKGTLIVR